MTKILVTGVAVLDFVFHMEKFPRTAEKYRADDATISGGGNAANAAVAIARLNGEAYLATRLGNDEIADRILAGLAREGVRIELARSFTGHRSSFSSIYIDAKGERQIMNYRDTSLSMKGQWLNEWLGNNPNAGFKTVLADTRWPHGAHIAMKYAHDHDLPGIMDAEAPVLEAKEAVYAASHVAFSAQGVRDFTGHSDIELAARAAKAQLPGKVLVTDGASGVLSFEQNLPVWHQAFKVDAVDSLGAGDVWHGAFALALAEDQPQRHAIRFANAAAALKCARIGGRQGAPDRNEVIQFLEKNT